MDPINIEKYNKSVARTGFKIRINLNRAIASLSMKGKKNLMRSLRLRMPKEFGEIINLKYEFSRHGVFFHKGVGRGYVMQGGRVIRGTKKGGIFKALPGMHSNTIKRMPKEWFNPTLDREMPRLADQIAKLKGDSAGKQLTKKIN